ncbi:hypothetical protein Poly51_55490 [Rubripirellula tenax]|uniref:Uncharacterized protein n=1 Tax=Rubripirellula tenax TaxID=2528015 RepID=A0A5C6ECI1_9BACT|nr:hypothetical protein [Rubripirellula tenax]TWU46154.1 hypothetical protein Poly51_55490 [Rubripirellula tenax]
MSDFRTGIRYGKDDHSIQIDKPSCPTWMSKEEYEGYPDFIMIREIKIHVTNQDFRTREIIVHTSLETDRTATNPECSSGDRRSANSC